MHFIVEGKDKFNMKKPRPSRACKELVVMVSIDPNYLDRLVWVKAQLQANFRKALENFLRQDESTFTWSIEDMVSIDPKVTIHELNIDLTYKPILEKRR